LDRTSPSLAVLLRSAHHPWSPIITLQGATWESVYKRGMRALAGCEEQPSGESERVAQWAEVRRLTPNPSPLDPQPTTSTLPSLCAQTLTLCLKP
jgi:hypothetical protein